MQATNTISTTESDIAFGWTGLNDSTTDTKSWVSGYTNKIDALQTVRIEIDQVSDGTVSPDTSVTATANIDGQWETAPVDLMPGTYQVTMEEFAATDTAYTTPLTSPSGVLLLDVESGFGEAPCFLTGTMILTPHGEVPVEQLCAGGSGPHARRQDPRHHLDRQRQGARPRRTPQPGDTVIVRKGAFSDNVPDRDLHVTKGHSLYLDGVLVASRVSGQSPLHPMDDRGPGGHILPYRTQNARDPAGERCTGGKLSR